MKIEHVALWVKDIDQVCEFYRKYFHAKVGELYTNSNKGFRSRFIEFDTGSRLEVMNQENLKFSISNSHLGYAHLSISVGSKEMVDNLTKKMKADGILIESEPRTTGDGYYESKVLDPEGNPVEITI